ncbi:MAG TPA: hypothetical protein VJL89_08480 [Thermodesulfovibrionia bacterium]|nr:hypothetical protein [Thermodesulfovibrionia bacterium]
MPVNKVTTTISQEDFNFIIESFNNIKSKMSFLITLTTEEKKSLPKFGDKSIAFVKKAYEIASKNQDFLPRNFDIDEMRKDVELYDQLFSIIQQFSQLMEKLEDTYREVGAEAYLASLIVYNTAKISGNDVGGLDSVMDELGKRFARKLTKKEEPNS